MKEDSLNILSLIKRPTTSKRTEKQENYKAKNSNPDCYQTMVTTAEFHTSEFLRVHIAGAVYCITDMILFDILKKIGDQYYLQMCIQINEFEEKRFIFRWDEIPKDVSEIYEYVNVTSVLEATSNGSYILYGNHIGRRQDHKYVLINFLNDPFNNTAVDSDYSELDDENTKFIAEIADNMRIVKML